MPAAAVFCRKGNVRVAKRIVFGFIYFSAHIQSAFKKNTKSAKHKANANKTLFDFKAAGKLKLGACRAIFDTHKSDAENEGSSCVIQAVRQ